MPVQKRSLGGGATAKFRGTCPCGWKGPEHESIADAHKDFANHQRREHRTK